MANFSLTEVFPLERTKRRYLKNAVLGNETFIISVDSEWQRTLDMAGNEGWGNEEKMTALPHGRLAQ